MRELIALAVIVVSTRLIDIEKGDYISAVFLVISIIAMIYFAAAIAERFNPNMRKWFRITPGKKTKLDEQEWQNIGKNKKNPPATATTPYAFSSKRPAADSPAPAALSPAEEEEKPQVEKTPPPLSDSGFVHSTKKVSSAEIENQFSDIFQPDDKTNN